MSFLMSVMISASQMYDVPVWLIQDIAKVESETCKYMEHKNPDGTFDLGCMQVNTKTAKAFGFDVYKLKHDKAYSIYAGVYILSRFKNKHQKHSLDYSWVCYYNTGDARMNKSRKKACNVYQTKLIKLRGNVYGTKLAVN